MYAIVSVTGLYSCKMMLSDYNSGAFDWRGVASPKRVGRLNVEYKEQVRDPGHGPPNPKRIQSKSQRFGILYFIHFDEIFIPKPLPSAQIWPRLEC